MSFYESRKKRQKIKKGAATAWIAFLITGLICALIYAVPAMFLLWAVGIITIIYITNWAVDILKRNRYC